MWFIISMVYMNTLAGTIPEILVYSKVYNDKPILSSPIPKRNLQSFIDEISQLKNPNATRIHLVV